MKFITEYNLRAQFNEQPFTEYRMEENSRLTPSARQFLVDKRIHILEAVSSDSKVSSGSKINSDSKENLETIPANQEKSPKTMYLLSSIEVLEGEFLVAISQIVSENIAFTNQLSKMREEFVKIRQILNGETKDSDACPEKSSRLYCGDCDQGLGNCFEISDFYVQSVNGTFLVQAACLRAKVRAARSQFLQILTEPEDEKCLSMVLEVFNRIINKLSQLICVAAEVKECRWIK